MATTSFGEAGEHGVGVSSAFCRQLRAGPRMSRCRPAHRSPGGGWRGARGGDAQVDYPRPSTCANFGRPSRAQDPGAAPFHPLSAAQGFTWIRRLSVPPQPQRGGARRCGLWKLGSVRSPSTRPPPAAPQRRHQLHGEPFEAGVGERGRPPPHTEGLGPTSAARHAHSARRALRGSRSDRVTGRALGGRGRRGRLWERPRNRPRCRGGRRPSGTDVRRDAPWRSCR